MLNKKYQKWSLIISIIILLLIGYLIYHIISNKKLYHQHPPSTYSGGDFTTFSVSKDSFARPFPTLDLYQMRSFTFGNKIFNTRWITAPGSVSSFDGLGPLFNAKSCATCHFKDGRGFPPPEGIALSNHPMIIKLSVKNKQTGKISTHPIFGDELSPDAILGVKPEGTIIVTYNEINGLYSDGTRYRLRKPNYHFTRLNQSIISDKFELLFSPRVANAVFGLGLLESISEQDIIKQVDVDDKNQDKISGKANYAIDPYTKQLQLGRFGWKAAITSIKSQIANAAFRDMGLSNIIFPKENCHKGQSDCFNAFSSLHDVKKDNNKTDAHSNSQQTSDQNLDLSNLQIEKTEFYLRHLAVPARRNLNDQTIKQGEKIFHDIGCASCHTPSFTTSKNYPIKELQNQKIFPYTDMLLHDMGEGLADNRPEEKANGREWRTAPLWGIGLIKVVNNHTLLLHDGRARNVEEAILWHGGEASDVIEKFKHLPKNKRNALIKFINSL